MLPMRVAGVALAVTVCALTGTACSSKSAPAPSATPTSSAVPSTSAAAAPAQPPAPAPAHAKTIRDYLQEKHLTEQQLHPGDPGAPVLTMPLPEGWVDAGPMTPKWAWSARKFNDVSMQADPPVIITLVSKLPGADPAQILQYAPGELQNLPGWQDAGTNCNSTLGGFKACQVGGMYMQDGQRRMMAQKTAAIPGKDGVYVVQINANGTERTLAPLMDATSSIDKSFSITVP